MPTQIKIIEGDCLESKIDGWKFIPHCCNDIGGFGSGFVAALNIKWPFVKTKYIQWKDGFYFFEKQDIPFKLGEVQYVKVEEKVVVCNMIGQHLMGADENGNPPIRYAALVKAMEKTGTIVKKCRGEIHAPFFGCGLAGGKEDIVLALINEIWCYNDIPVIMYRKK